MSDLTPRIPHRPLFWPDFILDLQDVLPNLSDQPVYAVGGAVRDSLLHKPVRDLDLTVAGQGIQLARRIANHFKGDFFTLDAERDVGRAFVKTNEGGLVIDVAGFRGEDLLSDLLDRDFTLNAMAAELTGDPNLLVDPLNGESDIRAKILRQCSSHSIADDPLRVIRAVRLSIQFGLRIEPETLRSAKAESAALQHVSPERLRDELVKILALSKVAGAVRVMEALGILAISLPEVSALQSVNMPGEKSSNAFQYTVSIVDYVAQIVAAFSPNRGDSSASFGIGALVMELDCYRQQIRAHLQKSWPNDRPHTALMALAALMLLSGYSQLEPPYPDYEAVSASLAEARGDALRLSRAESEYLARVLSGLAHVPSTLDDLLLHRFWYRYEDAGVDICLLSLANYLAAAGSRIDQDDWVAYVDRMRQVLQAYFDRYEQVVAPPSVIDGNRLIQALDLKPGPAIGQLLELIREAQVTGSVRSEDDAIALARDYLDHQR
ncbi:MAG: hypothetical protein K8L99_07860 [Anaerolineae bacterium]|nr:hypothetical protein [Anaerolineae bacterium]